MTERFVPLLVNADDLGWSKSVNEGIVEAHRSGLVTSASLLVAGRDAAHALELVHEAPELSVGIHLNIYRGDPVLPPEKIPTLLGRDGRFPGDWRITAARLAAGRIDLSEVEAEFSAAVERVIEAGIRPAHLDSEKHLHQWPSVFDTVCNVAERYSIPRVRVVREPVSLRPIAMGLSILGLRNARVARSRGLSFSDWTVGVTEAPTSPKALRRLLRSVPRGARTVELVCHPGHIDGQFMEIQAQVSNRLVEGRELELAALTDPAVHDLVSECGFELCASF